jgi:leucyl-tRNA synthetase
MFPYPSGSGLHVGHLEGYTATDIVVALQAHARLQRAAPDGLGRVRLPAEQYAVKTGIHPAITTAQNITTFRRQMKRRGLSYDWSREVNTPTPDYYRWTQWIFLQAVRARARPTCRRAGQLVSGVGTVLANEEIVDVASEGRAGFEVVRRPMRQWVLKITAYADRLIDDLQLVDWPASTLEMQKNWIGRSIGAEVDFPLDRRARQSAHLHRPGRTRCSARPTWCWRPSIRWSKR